MNLARRRLLRVTCAALVATALWPSPAALAAASPAAAPPVAEPPLAEPPVAAPPVAESLPGPPNVVDDQPAFDPSALAIRHAQFTLHQGFALTALGAMAATGGLGYWSAEMKGPAELRDLHLAAAGLTTGLYLTAGTLALTAPANPLQRGPGPWDTTALHQKGAWLHGAGMAATLGLGLATVFAGSEYTPYHGVAAAATFGLMALSAGVIAFGE